VKRKGQRPGIVKDLLTFKANLAVELKDDPGDRYARWLNNPDNAGATGTIVNHYKSGPLGLPMDDAKRLMAKWALSLEVSENIAVSRDLCDLIGAAGEDLPDDMVTHHHHLFAEHGFVWMEKPIQDEVGEHPIVALSWHNGIGWSNRTATRGNGGGMLPGIEINLWTMAEDIPVLLPGGADFLPYGLPSFGWIVDGEHRVPNPEWDMDLPASSLSRVSRFVITMQAFLRDELPAVARFPAPRSSAALMRRLDWPEPSVTVIDLRKRAKRPTFANDAEEAAWHLQNRHIVRGHWAKRHVGPTHPSHSGDGDQKETIYVYINPYIKGPEDAPFIMSEKVNALRR